MLYKAVAIILSTLFLAAFQMSAANAGCGGGGGFHAYQAQAHHRQASLKQSRPRKVRQVAAVKKKAPATQEARAETSEPSNAVAAEAASGETTTVAEGADNELAVASAAAGTCTRFFAETGTTVTVECAQQ